MRKLTVTEYLIAQNQAQEVITRYATMHDAIGALLAMHEATREVFTVVNVGITGDEDTFIDAYAVSFGTSRNGGYWVDAAINAMGVDSEITHYVIGDVITHDQ